MKKKTIIAIAVTAHVVMTIICLSIFYLFLAMPWAKPKLIKYYSNDDNYITAVGCIKSEYKYNALSFSWIQTESGTVYDTSSITLRKGVFLIYSNDSKKTWEELSPEPNMIISFIYSSSQPKEEFDPPIVQISINGKEILSYSEGKEALLRRLENWGKMY